MQKDLQKDVELLDGDTLVIPKPIDFAIAPVEAVTLFDYYRETVGMFVSDLMKLAGGTTRNADTSNIQILQADGRIQDSWVSWRKVEPYDALLIPQRIQRDTTRQENLKALKPLAILINEIRN